MTAETIEQIEAIPATYPATPSGLSTAAAALDPEMIWQRLEGWIAYRYSEREVKWIVDGCGEWMPPLAPATMTAVERWQADDWTAVTLSPSPSGGYVLPGGTYRFTANVGGGDVPASVNEAFRRLAEYMAQKPGKAGAISSRVSAGSVSISHRRSPSWMAEAMANSGAADLLRNLRRI